MDYTKKCPERGAVASYRRAGVPVAPGMTIRYVVRDARAGLKRARKLAVIAANDTTGVDAANVAKKQTVVRAPADGVVTTVAQTGAVLAPGATVATIGRPARGIQVRAADRTQMGAVRAMSMPPPA